MTISLNLDVDLQPSVEALAFLKELGYKQKGIQLREKERNDDASNVDIIDGLVNYNRDFFTPNQTMLNYIKATYENTIRKAMKRFERQSAKRFSDTRQAIKQSSEMTIRVGRLKGNKYSAMSNEQWKETGRKLAQNAHNKGIKECMLYWMGQSVAMIETQKVAGGGPLPALTAKYAAYKKKKFGFERPIGKASGQLLDNLAHTGSIRYTKSGEEIRTARYLRALKKARTKLRRKMTRAIQNKTGVTQLKKTYSAWRKVS